MVSRKAREDEEGEGIFFFTRNEQFVWFLSEADECQ